LLIQRLKRSGRSAAAAAACAAVVAMLAPVARGGEQDPILPPVEQILPPRDTLAARLTVTVKSFRFEGNTAFSDEELAEVVKEYVGRKLTSEELHEARQALSRHYVDSGYVNSGAVLPDQKVADGAVTFRIVEGELTRVEISGNEWTKALYIQPRVMRGIERPLDLGRLKDNLEILRQNPVFDRVQATLQPGTKPGQSWLDLTVEEARPYQLAVRFANQENPSVGAERINILAEHKNLTGIGDAVSVDYGLTTGGISDIEWACWDQINVRYSVPLTPWETTLRLGYERSDSLLIEEPFEELQINSESETFSVGVRQPLYRTPNSEFALSLTGERRTSESRLLGERFSFSPGEEDGVAKVSVLRFGQEWLTRTEKQVIAAVSVFSFGLPACGATDHDGDLPDSRFLAWLGQAQYVRRLGQTHSRIIARGTTQLVNSSMLPLEQFGIGGMYTVRGYRENQIVRDNGLVGSLELRIPLLRDEAAHTNVLEFASFFDIGYGWQVHEPTQEQLMCSAGLGLLLNIADRVDGRIYWGLPFRNFDQSDHNLQDSGIHFTLIVRAF